MPHKKWQVLKNTLQMGGSVTFPLEAAVPAEPAASPDSAKGFRLAGYLFGKRCGQTLWPLMEKYDEYEASNMTSGGSQDEEAILNLHSELMGCATQWFAPTLWGAYHLDPALTPNGAMLPNKNHKYAVQQAREAMEARKLFGLQEGSLLQIPQGSVADIESAQLPSCVVLIVWQSGPINPSSLV